MDNKRQKLILCRGLPGAGKSTLAEKLADEMGKESTVIVTADDFFTVEGTYQYKFPLIRAAHQYCFGEAFFHLFRGKNVIVPNTFVEFWQVAPYVELACELQIPYEIIEPKTKWKSNVAELTTKNVHNVPETTITKMSEKWETTKDILKKLEDKGWASVA